MQTKKTAPSPIRLNTTTQDHPACIITSIMKQDLKGLLDLAATDPTVFTEKRDGITPLHFAATCPDSATMIEIIIAAGTPIDAQTNTGDTALHLAARNNNMPAIKELLKKGADATVKNKAGKTALEGTNLQIKDLLSE